MRKDNELLIYVKNCERMAKVQKVVFYSVIVGWSALAVFFYLFFPGFLHVGL